jgi:hypothetical protein
MVRVIVNSFFFHTSKETKLVQANICLEFYVKMAHELFFLQSKNRAGIFDTACLVNARCEIYEKHVRTLLCKML